MIDKEILQYLYNNQNDKYLNLLDHLIEKYPDANRSDLFIVRETLDNLKAKGFVIFSSDDYLSMGMRDTSGIITLARIKGWNKLENPRDGILARITYDGIKEIEQLIFSQQIIKVNQSVIETNESFKILNETIIPDNFKLQKRIGNRTFIAIALSALFSLATIFVSIFLRDTQTQKTLQKQEQSLDNLKQSLQRIDSSLRKAVADSFYVPFRR